MRFMGRDQLISPEAAGRGGYEHELVEPDKSHTTRNPCVMSYKIVYNIKGHFPS